MAKCNKCGWNDRTPLFCGICTECIQKVLDKPVVLINDLLAYFNSYRGSCEATKLRNACLRHFNDEDVSVAKIAIYEEHPIILGEPPKRVGSRQKQKKEFNMDDIVEAFELLDSKSVSVVCATSNVKAMPKYNPEELDEGSMLERIMLIEATLSEHKVRLDENLARVTENKCDLEAKSRSIINVQNDVQTSIKLANESKEDLNKHKSDINQLKDTVGSANSPTWAGIAGAGVSHARNVGVTGARPAVTVSKCSVGIGASHSAIGNAHEDTHTDTRSSRNPLPGGGRGQGYNNNGFNNRDSQNNNYNNGYNNSGYNSGGPPPRRAPSRYGSTWSSVRFGAPLPSRYVVIERLLPHITKQCMHDYIKWKNHNVSIRSTKLMSRPDSLYKRYLVEVSLEHYDIVRREQFWPERVRVRNFKGNGSLWECTDIEAVPEEGTEATPEEGTEATPEEGTATIQNAIPSLEGTEATQNANVNEEVQPVINNV